MGYLAVAAAVTALSAENRHYTAELSPEWPVWGPHGGYATAILVRVALAHGAPPRVASASCHFLSVGRFAPVDIHVTTLRRARRAESPRCSMRQDGAAVAEALVWLAADDRASGGCSPRPRGSCSAAPTPRPRA